MIFESSAFVEIYCKYSITSFHTCGNLYQCSLNNDLSIQSPETAKISAIIGDHEKWQFTEDVTGFSAINKKIDYFPQNLNEFFKDLKFIMLKHNNLKEIHQCDLKSFKNLIHLTIANNPIEVLEDGLFNYNTNLEAIGFEHTKIVHIGPNIFDNLSKLITFWFGQVPCINENIDNSRAVTLRLIQRSKEQCVNEEFIQIKEDFENFKKEIMSIDPTAYNEKIKEFTKVFQSSKYSRYSPLKEDFEKLNIWASNVMGYY